MTDTSFAQSKINLGGSVRRFLFASFVDGGVGTRYKTCVEKPKKEPQRSTMQIRRRQGGEEGGVEGNQP